MVVGWKCGLAGKYTRAAAQLPSPLARRIVKSMAVAQREFPSSIRPARLASRSHLESPLKLTFYLRVSPFSFRSIYLPVIHTHVYKSGPRRVIHTGDTIVYLFLWPA